MLFPAQKTRKAASGFTLADRKASLGFTLAELLISLAILGEIATFTIPKILSSSQNSQFKAVAKADMAAISGAYQMLSLNGGLTTATTGDDFLQYLNYVATISDGSLTIDQNQSSSTATCNGSPYSCIKMHNGSVIAYRKGTSFGGSAYNNGIFFLIDPDGKAVDGTPNGFGKSLVCWIYYNGRMTDVENIYSPSYNSYTNYSPTAAQTPSWFSW